MPWSRIVRRFVLDPKGLRVGAFAQIELVQFFDLHAVEESLAKMSILFQTSELLCRSNCAPNTTVVCHKLEVRNAVPKKRR